MGRAGVAVGLLLLLPAAVIVYRVIWLSYPLFPTVPGKTWAVVMEARLKPDEGGIEVAIGLPTGRAAHTVIEEEILSSELDFDIIREGPNRMGVWSGPVAIGGETILYRASVVVRPRSLPKGEAPSLPQYPAATDRVERALAERLVAKWGQLPLPARLRAVAAAAWDEWGVPWPDSPDLLAWARVRERHGSVVTFLLLLRAARIPARVVECILLSKIIVTRPVVWVEAWDGERWSSFHPETGEFYRQADLLLPLARGGLGAVRVSSGEVSEIRWAVRRETVSNWVLHFERIRRSNRFLDRWSLFRLPAEFQETFRILLLVPIGALLVAALRNVAGFSTFGTFMPVLMALAFRNTGLLYGLGIFASLIAVGYGVRRAVNNLRLLLVPRLSFLLTLVIVALTIFALIGSKLAVREFMAVGLLPIVILTMTIERFFVITEEAGAREGFRTALGSAAVATITYGIIHWEPLQLTFFVYPELILAIAALQVLLGRYSGYRLSEFLRFRELRRT